jgi:hypothetical protein
MPGISAELEEHYKSVEHALTHGRVVPLLGAGVNLCGRPPDARWADAASFLPSGGELAEYLAKPFGYAVDDLARVAQTVAVMQGPGPLYESLRKVFDADYAPTALHRFLARLPEALRARGAPRPYQLIVTTNYDDVLETAFREAAEPYDLVWYMAEGASRRGKFWHWPPPQQQCEPRLIEVPNEYQELSLATRTVILKFHGAVDRTDSDRDSYVITEDHYIDYLTRTEIASLVPVDLVAKLLRSHFLFLGYALRDWNVRVILHRLWSEQELAYRSWAIQLGTSDVDRRMWQERKVEIHDVDLLAYVTELARRLGVAL